jgi:hypothetical protein
MTAVTTRTLTTTTKPQITTSFLADLILNRRITKLVNMFSKHEIDKIRQVKEIFNHECQNIYTGKIMKNKLDSQIVYLDDNYVVVRITLPNYNYYSEYVSASTHHRCVVLGVDNNQVWIHELPWAYFFDHDDHVWTLDNIKTVMGFDEELKHDMVFECRSRVRVQGDVIIQKLEPIDIFGNISDDYLTDKKLLEKELKQTNLIIGNHLIIIQKAVQIRSIIGDNIMPLVLENTQCYIFHDEHDYITLYLNPGLYSFDLLRRR